MPGGPGLAFETWETTRLAVARNAHKLGALLVFDSAGNARLPPGSQTGCNAITNWVPHPRHVFVLVARVGEHKL